ncbi:helix-turn-helix transcriptional regulator [Nocardioides speluncae]|uniref:helix-turn-helix transcriptional regulator n=1 Tax=Nocardioides speluncae TaxID=2670337 RepID=UPI000D696A79|nr:YafY family protein [Nocardioides speluncae]
MRSSRLVSILLLLQARGRLTAQELADELEVSLRTVYRDMDALSTAGVPVYAEQGRAGGYRLVDGYRTRLTGLTDGEARSLFLVGLPGAARALGLEGDAAAAELKLLAALGGDQRARAGRLRERFHVDLPGWYRDADDTPHLAALAEAVLGDRWVSVTYRRWEAPREVERTLAPYGLVLKNGTWYAVAATRDRDGTRTYRVSNILALQPTSEAFKRPSDFDLADHWTRHLAAFDARRITGTATIRIAPTLVRRLSDFGDPELRRAAAGGAVGDDGWTRAVLNIESVDHAARQLIGHGTEVEVVDPPELRAELGRRGASLVETYAGAHGT